MIKLSLLLIVAIQATSANQSSSLEMPRVLEPFVSNYMNCLQTKVSERRNLTQEEIMKVDVVVLSDCSATRLEESTKGNAAMKSNGWNDEAQRKTLVEDAFVSVDGSFKEFVNSLRKQAGL